MITADAFERAFESHRDWLYRDGLFALALCQQGKPALILPVPPPSSPDRLAARRFARREDPGFALSKLVRVLSQQDDALSFRVVGGGVTLGSIDRATHLVAHHAANQWIWIAPMFVAQVAEQLAPPAPPTPPAPWYEIRDPHALQIDREKHGAFADTWHALAARQLTEAPPAMRLGLGYAAPGLPLALTYSESASDAREAPPSSPGSEPTGADGGDCFDAVVDLLCGNRDAAHLEFLRGGAVVQRRSRQSFLLAGYAAAEGVARDTAVAHATAALARLAGELPDDPP